MIYSIEAKSYKPCVGTYAEEFQNGTFYPDAMLYVEPGFLVGDYSALGDIEPAPNSPVVYRTGEHDDHPKTRSCTIRWAHRNDSDLINGILDKVSTRVNEANESIYKMEIDSGATLHSRTGDTMSGFMVADYVKNDWFKAHRDVGVVPSMNKRKLSVVIQMTDPSLYEGGDLWISNGFGLIKAPKSVGTLLLFPSYQFHQVDAMVSGQRRSLVFWFEGREPFR